MPLTHWCCSPLSACRRKATQDVTSLRAIPWIFAWTQVGGWLGGITRVFSACLLSWGSLCGWLGVPLEPCLQALTARPPHPFPLQTRLVLPAWLGVADALLAAASSGKRAMLREMYEVSGLVGATRPGNMERASAHRAQPCLQLVGE